MPLATPFRVPTSTEMAVLFFFQAQCRSPHPSFGMQLKRKRLKERGVRLCLARGGRGQGTPSPTRIILFPETNLLGWCWSFTRQVGRRPKGREQVRVTATAF